MPSGRSGASTARSGCTRGAGGSLTLTAFFEQIDTLQEAADERGQGILSALYDYAEQIAAERE